MADLPRDINWAVTQPPQDGAVGEQFTAYGTCPMVGQNPAPVITATLKIGQSTYTGSVSYGNGTWEALFTGVKSGTGGTLTITCTGMTDQVINGLTTGVTAVEITAPTDGQVYTNWEDHSATYTTSPDYTITSWFVTQAGAPLPTPASKQAQATGPAPTSAVLLYDMIGAQPAGHDFVVHFNLQSNAGGPNLFVSSGYFRVENAG